MSTLGEHTGALKWYSESKGYGFIGKDGGSDIFLHASAARKCGLDTTTLQEGDELRFDIETGQKGDKAVNISRI